MARWQGDKPVVSILVPTYQHADFIEDALRGVLGQETEFPFEVIVRDDASTDGTAEIVEASVASYPNIIRAIFNAKNEYPQVKPLVAMVRFARGEFVALCEGDDYWIQRDKLKMQLDVILSQAFSCSICTTRAVEINESSQIVGVIERGGTRTIVIRRDVCLELIARHPDIIRETTYIDALLQAFAGSLGFACHVPAITAVYRRNSSPVSSVSYAQKLHNPERYFSEHLRSQALIARMLWREGRYASSCRRTLTVAAKLYKIIKKRKSIGWTTKQTLACVRRQISAPSHVPVSMAHRLGTDIN